MDDLRDEIAEIVQAAICKGGMYEGGANEAADRILAIPTVRNALAVEAALANVNQSLTVSAFRRCCETTKEIVGIIEKPPISTGAKRSES